MKKRRPASSILRSARTIARKIRKNGYADMTKKKIAFLSISIALCATAWLGGVSGKRYAWAKTARAQQRVAGRAGT